MYKNNLIFLPIVINKNKYYGYIDTGGGTTFLFRKKHLLKNIKETNKYIINKDLEKFPQNVIIFIGQDFFKNKIVQFNYPNKIFKELKSIPTHNYHRFPMIKSKKNNFIHTDVVFEDKKYTFLFDTGARLDKNNKHSAISFLDGNIFDKLEKKYKIIKNYSDDRSPVIIIPEITVFNKVIKNIKFLRRKNNIFTKWMSNITGIKHIGAIGGNVLKNFDIICDYKNKYYYVKT